MQSTKPKIGSERTINQPGVHVIALGLPLLSIRVKGIKQHRRGFNTAGQSPDIGTGKLFYRVGQQSVCMPPSLLIQHPCCPSRGCTRADARLVDCKRRVSRRGTFRRIGGDVAFNMAVKSRFLLLELTQSEIAPHYSLNIQAGGKGGGEQRLCHAQ